MGPWVAGDVKVREVRQGRQLSWYLVDVLKLATRRGNGKGEPKSQQPDFSMPSVMGNRAAKKNHVLELIGRTCKWKQ